MRRIICLNQVISPITIDILNEFSNREVEVELYYGQSYKTYSDLSPKIITHKQNPYRRDSFFKRLLSWTKFFLRTFFRLFFKKKNYELFIVTNPPFNVFTGLILNKFFGVNYYLLIFDIYPDAIVQYKYLSAKNPLIRFWKYLMKKSLNRAKNIFTISEVMKDSLEKYNTNGREIHVIHNWVDNSQIKPLNKQENLFASEYSLTEKKVVLYSGNFGKTHDLESIMEAARILKENANIHFLIIGDGEKRKLIARLKKEYSLENVILLPFQSEEVFPYSMATGDLAIVSLGLEAESLSVPSKTYYMMAAGCALIALASEESELAGIVKKHQIGVVSKPGDPELLARNILSILEDDIKLDLLKLKSREVSYLYSSENAKIYSSVIGL